MEVKLKSAPKVKLKKGKIKTAVKPGLIQKAAQAKNSIKIKKDKPKDAVNPNLSDKAVIDYALVRDAIDNHNQKAYAELMSRYKDSIYFMLLKMVNNRDDAEDLTIEAFGKAFKNIKQYTPDYAFSTWLFKIATNNCIDFIRKKRKQTFSIDKGFEGDDGEEMMLEVKSEAMGPEEKMMKKQKVEAMRDVVDKLKPRYKNLVELRYFRELSYEEIAIELSLPLGTVKAQLFRAREFLYQIMKNSEHKI
jgi:RNA polymerase sigma-70 factor (ECF subfamily)